MRVFLWPQPNTIDSYTDRFQEPITPFMVVHGGGVASVSLARFIYRYDTAPGGNYSAPGMPRWRNTPEQRAQDWKWFLAGTFRTRFPLLALGSGDYLVAAIDIDNDGKPEPIYVHPKGIYEPLDMSSGALVNTALYVPVILNSTLTEADTVRTRRLLRPGIEPELFRSQAIVVSGSKRSDVRKRVSIVLGSIDFRIFTFDGLTYLLHDLTKLNWGLAGPPKPPWKEIGTSRVWLTKNGTTNEICAFE